MRTFPLALAAALAALPSAARAASPTPRAASPSSETAAASRPTLGYDLRIRAWGGAFDGFRTIDASGSFASIEAGLTPELRSGKLRIDLPLRAEHVARPGDDLSETLLAAAIEPDVRVSRTVSLGAEGGVTWVDRPDWPDVYQYQADGSLLPTDRYGYLSWRAGANAWFRAGGGQHLRARYRYQHYSYEDDPAFDPADPSHLTPRDNARHELSLSWRFLREGWSATAGIDSWYRLDEVALSREAGTGATVPGGVENPLQRLARTEPSLEVEWKRLGGRVDLRLAYGVAFQTDRHEGYYSGVEQHPSLRAIVALGPRLEGRLDLEGRFLRYGPDSTSATRLESGDRRSDTKLGAGAGLAYALGRGLSLLAEVSYLDRYTNFPDYVPNGVPPDYDIDWDYRDVSAAIGVEWRARHDADKRR